MILQLSDGGKNWVADAGGRAQNMTTRLGAIRRSLLVRYSKGPGDGSNVQY